MAELRTGRLFLDSLSTKINYVSLVLVLTEKITQEDRQRVKLLQTVYKKGLKDLSLQDLKKLQNLVEKKDYSHNKKAHKSKMKLLTKINSRIYELEEGKGIFS